MPQQFDSLRAFARIMPLPMNHRICTLITNDLRIPGSLAKVTDSPACLVLLRSLAHFVARVPITMALLTELFAAATRSYTNAPQTRRNRPPMPRLQWRPGEFRKAPARVCLPAP